MEVEEVLVELVEEQVELEVEEEGVVVVVVKKKKEEE